MSRLKRFAHSLISGYLMLGTNILYTLASVPLALHYLPTRTEFGLWALTSQIMVYLNLVDLGLAASASRILIDYKDRRTGGEYGGVVQTTVLVGMVQGGLVCLAGLAIALVAGPLMNVPVNLQGHFFWLLAGQSVLTAAGLASKIFNLMLSAHQRFDVSNHAGTAALIANFGSMWVAFSSGLGVYSLLVGQLAGLTTSLAVSAWACRRFGFMPSAHEWGRPSWIKFRELFHFAQNVFLYNIGAQLVSASQTILLTRLVGLDAATVWNVSTRAYGMLTVVIYRVFDFSSSALAEMMVRGERAKLQHRFRQIVEVSMSLAVAAAVMFAIGNSTFLHYWTHGKISWAPVNDLLLAVWLVLCVSVHAHTGFVGQSKIFRFMRFIFLIEGSVFIGLMVLLHALGRVVTVPAGAEAGSAEMLSAYHGITLMLLASIGCCLCFSLPYGLYRTQKYFGMTWGQLAVWHRQPLWLAAGLVPVAAGAWWAMGHLPVTLQLVVILPVLGLWATFALFQFGLSRNLRLEIAGRLPFLKKIVRAES